MSSFPRLSVIILGSLAALFAPGVAGAAVCTLTVGSPADGSVAENSPSFTWTADSACTNMRVQLSDDPTFLRRVINTTWSSATSATLAESTWDAYQAGRWASGVYWRVQGKNRWGAVTSTAVGHLVMDPDYDDDGVSLSRGDCNDRDATVYPGALEVCDLLDNDCDGTADDGLSTQTVYQDIDADTYGNPWVSSVVCSAAVPAGWSLDGTDCDDWAAFVNPGAPEVCDEVDDDCDGKVDEGFALTTLYEDADWDGFGNPDSSLETCLPELYQGYGWSQDDTDCDDWADSAHPGADELCNEGDDDCDGVADNGLPTTLLYEDADWDGYGDPTATMETCALDWYLGWGWSDAATETDCDDTNWNIFPGAEELYGDGIDQDCDGEDAVFCGDTDLGSAVGDVASV